MAQQLSTNTFTVAKWVVSANATQGTHTTIAGAIASASSGDTIFIRDGTYTENLTLKAGVDIVAFGGDDDEPNVTIIGKSTFTTAGTVTLSSIRLQTNSDFYLAVTGSADSVVNLISCYLNASNNTGISYTSSSGSSGINITDCSGTLGTTGIGYFTNSGAGIMSITNTFWANAGGSTTASTISAGSLQVYSCNLNAPITTSGTSGILLFDSQIGATNTTNLTVGGSGTNSASNTSFNSGSASAISVIATLQMKSSCSVASSNTNAITGAGTLNYSPINFTSTSSNINTTTQGLVTVGPSVSVGSSNSGATNSLTVFNNSNTSSSFASVGTSVGGTTSEDPYFLTAIGSTRCYAIGLDNSDSDRFKITTAAAATNTPSAGTTVLTSDGTNIWVTGLSFDSGSNVLANYATGTFTPVIFGTTGAGTATYTSQVGRYTRIGNRCFYFVSLAFNTFTGTGNFRMSGLPFTVNANDSSSGIFSQISTLATGASTIPMIQAQASNTNLLFATYNPTTAAYAGIAVVAAATFVFSGSYEI